MCHDRERSPGVPLIGVVGARDEVEQKRERILGGHGNSSLGGARWTQISQRQVNREVAVLIEKERDECQVHLHLAEVGLGVERVVDIVADVEGEAPVVAAILEQIHDRHRGVREAMHEHRLQQTLHVVNRPANGRNPSVAEEESN